MKYLLGILSLLWLGCSSSTYEVSEPLPTLQVVPLHTSYTIDEPFHLQVKASQGGYHGAYKLCVTLNEGACDLQRGSTKIPGKGEWTAMQNSTEVLTVTPRQTGRLRLTFEVMTGEGLQSGRNMVNLTVIESGKIVLDIDFPQTSAVFKPMKITLTANKSGVTGPIQIKYDPQLGIGTLQFGAVIVKAGDKFSVPTNNPQVLYYTPSARGTHRLQFAASDEYTTEYKIIEFIITN